MPSISVRKLYQDNQQKLQMAWTAGTAGGDNRISVEADRPALALVGHLNFIHHNQVQVLGVAEVAYLQKLEQSDNPTGLDELFNFPMALVIVANDFARAAKSAQIIATRTMYRCSRPRWKAHI